MSDVEDRLRILLAKEWGVEPDRITREAKLIDDLEGDSLDVVGLVMSVEEEFGINISDDQSEQIASGTFGDLVDLVPTLI